MRSKDVLKKIFSNKVRSGFIVLTDVLFYLLFFIISPWIFSRISPTKELFTKLSFFGMSWLIVVVILIFAIFVYFMLVLIYSFCKHLVIFQLESTMNKKKLNFSSLLKFFHSNLVLPAILMFVFYFLLLVLRDVPNINILGWAWLSFLSLLFVFLYAVQNTKHSLFGAGKKHSFSAALDELSLFKKYKQLAISNIASIVLFFLLFAGIGYTIQYLVKSFKIGANIYNIYDPVFGASLSIFLYLLFFYNRAYFYYAARDKR